MFRTFPAATICVVIFLIRSFAIVNRHAPNFVCLPQLNLLQLIKFPRQVLSLDFIKTLIFLTFLKKNIYSFRLLLETSINLDTVLLTIDCLSLKNIDYSRTEFHYMFRYFYDSVNEATTRL